MKKKITIITGILFLVIIIFCSLRYYFYNVERRFAGNNLQTWTGGQKACGIIWNKEPAAHRQLLNHPDLQIRFATACIVLNRTNYSRTGKKGKLLSPRNGYTQEDIDKAFKYLKEGFKIKDKSSAGLRRYVAEHFSPGIYDKRLIEVLVIAMQDEDVAHGTSSIGATGSLRDLTCKYFPSGKDWEKWYNEHKAFLEWNGRYFESKKEHEFNELDKRIKQNLTSVIGVEVYGDFPQDEEEYCLGWFLCDLSRDYGIPIIVESDKRVDKAELKFRSRYGLLKDILKDFLNQLDSQHDVFVKDGILRIKEKGFGSEKKYPFRYYTFFPKGVPEKWEDLILTEDEKLFPKNFVGGVPDKWRDKWKEVLNEKRTMSSLYKGDSDLIPLCKGEIYDKDIDEMMYYSLRPLRIYAISFSSGTGLSSESSEDFNKRRLEFKKKLKPRMSIEKLVEDTVRINHALCYIYKNNAFYESYKKNHPEMYDKIKDKDEPYYQLSFKFSSSQSDYLKDWISNWLSFKFAQIPLTLTSKGKNEYLLTVENNTKTPLSFRNFCSIGNKLALYAQPKDNDIDVSYIILPFKNYESADFVLKAGEKKNISIKLNDLTPVKVLKRRLDIKDPRNSRVEYDEDITWKELSDKNVEIKPVITFYSMDYKKAFRANGNWISLDKND